ncbi:MAG: 4-hydroxythreonine-4-phosphate dehydrogenase PdxA [Acidobacteria bacterium]|nr:MAG: 4-hydroxythreonine-4-phosphate dehydrogenase PdxA [Acidobacteriota bacterium]
MSLPRIGITEGDPAGIGPEIARKAMSDARVREVCEPLVYGSAQSFTPGVLSAQAGHAACETIVRAVRDAQAGAIQGIATAPINKEALALAGLPWRGHTEMLAELTHAPRVAMMFWSEKLRVVLATIHIPLSAVPAALTIESVADIIELTHRELPRFGIARPRIAMAGLNPHAGEHGLLGTEETDVLDPAVARSAKAGIDIAGPFPGDTIFLRAMRGEFDVVVACYHDQGLIPIKMAAFGQAVNVTLGLPIIRTSVDHGTAFDIAGKGTADPESMVQAVLLAAKLAAG